MPQRSRKSRLLIRLGGSLLMAPVWFATTALAASPPPETLPRGFLEQLPLLLALPEAEYDRLVGEDRSPSVPQRSQQPGSSHRRLPPEPEPAGNGAVGEVDP